MDPITIAVIVSSVFSLAGMGAGIMGNMSKNEQDEIARKTALANQALAKKYYAEDYAYTERQAAQDIRQSKINQIQSYLGEQLPMKYQDFTREAKPYHEPTGEYIPDYSDVYTGKMFQDIGEEGVRAGSYFGQIMNRAKVSPSALPKTTARIIGGK